jgi:hypothetical protein
MAVTHTLREFKNAYLQKAIRLDDVAVFSTESGDIFKIGQVVNFTAKNGTTPAYIQKDASPAVGDYIIAQGDDTALPYGHVPVEDKNYKPKDYVAVTEDTAMDAYSITKSVVVYKITDLDDLISR